MRGRTRDCRFECRWRYGSDDEFSDGIIKYGAVDRLAQRQSTLLIILSAVVASNALSPMCVVADGHPNAAPTAQNEPLEQRRSFAGRIPSSITAEAAGVR
jgi:hypothetical protein